MIPWLNPANGFPDTALARIEPNGLLCAGGDLEPATIIDAYSRGIFPWFSDDQPILWWSPDPRMVLFPAEFKISKSLAKTVKSEKFETRFDSAFTDVIAGCAARFSANRCSPARPTPRRLHWLRWWTSSGATVLS